jgi:dUTP pyrophosphatase
LLLPLFLFCFYFLEYKMIIEFMTMDDRITADHLKPKTQGSAGIDLHACIPDTVIIDPGERVLVPTGVAVHIRDRGYAGFIFARSGLAHREGLTVGNAVGVIDSDYQGQLMVSLWNSSPEKRFLNPMDRFAQIVIMPVAQNIEFEQVYSFPCTFRGSAGFGSTGV